MTLNTNPLESYTQEHLPCGVTLIHKEVRTVPIVAIDVWISVGAAGDPDPYLGLSHFYEHMFFKGTERLGVGEMDQAIKRLGGYNNAATAWDYTHYYVVVPSPGWRRASEVLIDALRFPVFDPVEIESERQVIYEEIKRHEDTPWSKFYQDYNSLAFSRCPYSRQILGTFETLSRIDQNVFREFLQTRYVPENITVVVVGDVSIGEVRDQMQSYFEGMSTASRFPDDIPFEAIGSPQHLQLHMDVNQSYLLLGYPTPTVVGSRDEAILDLASVLLGEGRSSRLHGLLKEELGLVSSVSVSLWSQAKAGLFIVEAVTDPENLAEVEKHIHEQLHRLAETPPDEEELRRVKHMALADYAFSNETVSAMAHTYGSSHLLSGIDYIIRYPEMIRSIEAEEIPDRFRRYLQENMLCVGHLMPKQ